MSNEIIEKLKKSGLTGRGGGGFPTGKKWQMVKEAPGKTKYVVCNASEGEPGIAKDYHLFTHHPQKVIAGMALAIKFLGAKKGYIYLNPDYHKKLAPVLTDLIGSLPIEVFKKPHQAGYVGGEETSALNAIEGRRIEPRLRPPYPPQSGLWNSPTLVNNVETFYDACLIANGEYAGKRFYTINGDCLWTGVYEYPENWTIEKILKETENYPNFDFFVQVGGEASGEVLNAGQLDKPAGGGAITVYSVIKHDPMKLIRKWIEFFYRQSCGQCTPCREGTYRIFEMLADKEPNWTMIDALLDNLAEASFCGLGCSAPIAITSYVANVFAGLPDNRIKITAKQRKMICDCFK